MQNSLPTQADRPLIPTSREALLPVIDLGKQLNMSPRTLDNWRTAGRGPRFIKTGPRGVLYQWGDVLDWLDGRKVQSTSENVAA